MRRLHAKQYYTWKQYEMNKITAIVVKSVAFDHEYRQDFDGEFV